MTVQILLLPIAITILLINLGLWAYAYISGRGQYHAHIRRLSKKDRILLLTVDHKTGQIYTSHKGELLPYMFEIIAAELIDQIENKGVDPLEAEKSLKKELEWEVSTTRVLVEARKDREESASNQTDTTRTISAQQN